MTIGGSNEKDNYRRSATTGAGIMRYVSETTLRAMFTSEGYPTKLADIVIAEITEDVTVIQWQTLEEFRAKPADGWCFVSVNGWIHRATYANGSFADTEGSAWKTDQIDMVAHVPTPEAPK